MYKCDKCLKMFIDVVGSNYYSTDREALEIEKSFEEYGVLDSDTYMKNVLLNKY